LALASRARSPAPKPAGFAAADRCPSLSQVESAKALGLKIPPKLLTANANVG
jgi:hypothetical protein